ACAQGPGAGAADRPTRQGARGAEAGGRRGAARGCFDLSGGTGTSGSGGATACGRATGRARHGNSREIDPSSAAGQRCGWRQPDRCAGLLEGTAAVVRSPPRGSRLSLLGPRVVDAVAQLLARLEAGDAPRWDLDGLACLRVAASAGRRITGGERTEA